MFQIGRIEKHRKIRNGNTWIVQLQVNIVW